MSLDCYALDNALAALRDAERALEAVRDAPTERAYDSIQDVARTFAVHTNTVRNWCGLGTSPSDPPLLRCVRVGGRIRVPKWAVDELARSGAVNRVGASQ